MKFSKEQLIDPFIDLKRGSFRPLGRFVLFSAFFVQSALINPDSVLLGASACSSYSIILGIGSERLNRGAANLVRTVVRVTNSVNYGKNS